MNGVLPLVLQHQRGIHAASELRDAVVITYE